jgi:hypothetical protein
VKHRYHLEIVRLFHNVLSATVANLEHSTRAALLFRRLAVESFRVAFERDREVRNCLAFLIAIRDFSIHRGAHASVDVEGG